MYRKLYALNPVIIVSLLRIDNSRQDVIRATLLFSAAIISTLSYHTSNCSLYSSLSNKTTYVWITSVFMKIWILNLFFHFYFLNMDISLNIYTPVMKLYTGAPNIALEGSMSQIFLFRPWFLFYIKKRVTFGHFLKLYFLDFIK